MGGRKFLIAAVEGGGTSFVVAVAEVVVDDRDHSQQQQSSSLSSKTFEPPKILHRHEVDSSHDSPHKTLQECADFFRKYNPCNHDDSAPSGERRQRRRKGYDALGVASFGPVGLNPDKKETYGRILPSTPKESWRNIDVLTPLIEACKGTGTGDDDDDDDDDNQLLVKIDTDVNAPALAEFMAATSAAASKATTGATTPSPPKITSVAYVTVGTGVGVGLVVNSQTVHGRMHPEGGHIPIQPLPGDTAFDGYSWGNKAPFFGRRTVESMTSSVALSERLQMMSPLSSSKSKSTSKTRQVLAEIEDDDHEIWDHAANALACLCVSLILTLSIEKIVLGGGVMKRNGLIEKIRHQTTKLMNGYVDLPPPDSDDMKNLICTSSFGGDIGLIGALVLAQRVIMEDMKSIASQRQKQQRQLQKKMTSTTTAFYVGALHGVIFGAVITALGWMAFTATLAASSSSSTSGDKRSMK